MKNPVLPLATLTLLALAAGCNDQRFSADEIIKSITGPSRKELALQALNPDDPDGRRRATLELSDRDWGLEEPYTKIYVLQVDDENPQVRSAAMTALGRTGDPNFLPQLLTGLEDPHEQVRIDAAIALQRVHGLEAIGPLKTHAGADDSYHVRVEAIEALAQYQREDVVELLITLLDDPQFGVRYTARQTLVGLTGEDCGYDTACWRQTLADKQDLFAPAPDADRPWWDWLGVTDD
jgi:HEAT repeat protein